MLYWLLKEIFRIAVKVYFNRLSVSFEKEIPSDKPIVLLSNHQSAFMDAILIAVLMKRPLHFMTRGESFLRPINRWILAKLNMVPIYRKEHTPGLTHKNFKIIQNYIDLLKNNGALLTFPEGVNKTDQHLHPFKTGSARIILGAAAQSGYELDIAVIPVGLNYTDPHQFRSDVQVNFGSPIPLKEYYKVYKSSNRPAVNALTMAAEQSVEALMINYDDEQMAHLSKEIELLYKRDYNGDYNPGRNFKLNKDIVKGIRHLKSHHPGILQSVDGQLRTYIKLLRDTGLNSHWLRAISHHKDNPARKPDLFFWLKLPVYYFARIKNFLPLKFSKWAADKWTPRADFYGSYLLAFGAMSFILYYFLLLFALYLLSNSAFITIAYLIAVIASGKLALNFHPKYVLHRSLNTIRDSKHLDSRKINELIKLRDDIIKTLKNVREKYLGSVLASQQEKGA